MQASCLHASFAPTAPGNSGFEDIYANDICRTLSLIDFDTSEDVIAHLKGLSLGDDFWMYSFKVVPCAKTHNHKWTLCPCGHQGETARRRDPRLLPYKAVLCPLVKVKKTCPLGDQCLWSHNVFERYLHPSRYKTRLCTYGHTCARATCFFAHDATELRVITEGETCEHGGEREFLLQLQLAQEAGMISTTAAYHAYQALNRPFPGHQQNPQNQPKPHSTSFSGPLYYPSYQWQQQQQQQGSSGLGASLLYRLQDSMANSGASGGSAVNRASNSSNLRTTPSAQWNGQGQLGRMSDPGMRDDSSRTPQRMASAAPSGIGPMPNRNRISEGGQTGMDDLRPWFGDALAGGNAVDYRSASTLASPRSTGPGSPQAYPSPGQCRPSFEGQAACGYAPPALRSRDPSSRMPASPHGGGGSLNDWSLIRSHVEDVFVPPSPPHLSLPSSRDISGTWPVVAWRGGGYQLLPAGSQQDLSEPLIFIGHQNSSDASSGSLYSNNDVGGVVPLTASSLANLDANDPIGGGSGGLDPLLVRGGSSASDACVHQLVVQLQLLQEQGIIISKQELIQSLTQLLGRLLSGMDNNP